MIIVPDPELQIDFSFALGQMRTLYLQDALSNTVRLLNIADLDRELAEMVPPESLSSLASQGLRGELLFPVPSLLRANPRLLGYYRLLYGFSQKEFYTAATGLVRYRNMEKSGKLSKACDESLTELSAALIIAGVALMDGIGAKRISRSFFDDLTLLTIGPQLRGGRNVRKGITSIVKVFETIHHIVEEAALNASSNRIEINNAAGRKVLIEFAPDPDIIIREEMGSSVYREVIAIEVKGGSDFSNIHNRIGEAEKSHQKARGAGYVECWTVVNVDRIDIDMARRESPSTNRFYRLSALVAQDTDEYADFRNRIVSLTGIRV
jgi:hypothetical protein